MSKRLAKTVLFTVLLLTVALVAGCGGRSNATNVAGHAQSSSAAASVSASAVQSQNTPANAASAEATVVPNQNAQPSIPDGAIQWSHASDHVGEVVMVYGRVMSTKYASSSNGSPTFLDLGATYPDRDRVTITIWGRNRSAFSSAPEMFYRGKTLCVKGEVYLYNGVCNIEVSSPSQIAVL